MRFPAPPGPTKRRGWATRPSKVTSYTSRPLWWPQTPSAQGCDLRQACLSWCEPAKVCPKPSVCC
ncbi:hypothetical protein LEMLEM_LOCUS182 [Lemmus lemmus]